MCLERARSLQHPFRESRSATLCVCALSFCNGQARERLFPSLECMYVQSCIMNEKCEGDIRKTHGRPRVEESNFFSRAKSLHTDLLNYIFIYRCINLNILVFLSLPPVSCGNSHRGKIKKPPRYVSLSPFHSHSSLLLFSLAAARSRAECERDELLANRTGSTRE